MKREANSKVLRTVVVFCLVGLYFIMAMAVTLLGSSIYRGVVASSDETSTQRIALSYVANQVRRNAGQNLAVGEFEGCDALRFEESTPEGYVYVTYVYCYEGTLRELYTEAGSGLKPEDGAVLIDLDKLEFTVSDGLLTVLAGDAAGRTWTLDLCPAGGIEEVGVL